MIFKFQSYNVQARIEPNLDWIDVDLVKMYGSSFDIILS